MTQKAAALYDAGAPGAGEAANMAKYAAAEAAIHCVDQAIQTHGGNGFALEYGLTDLWWGVRLVRTAPVSREMILNYVAEHSLGPAEVVRAAGLGLKRETTGSSAPPADDPVEEEKKSPVAEGSPFPRFGRQPIGKT